MKKVHESTTEKLLKDLKAEYQSGHKMMAETEANLGDMGTSLLPSSGALQGPEEH